MKSFLLEEQSLEKSAAEVGTDHPLLYPSSRIRLTFESDKGFGCPRLHEFLARYGNQVNRLTILHKKLPYGEGEMRLYQMLPNLQHLFIQGIGKRATNASEEVSEVPIPEVFSKLATLRIIKDSPRFPVSRLLESCTNIHKFSNVLNGMDPQPLQDLLTVLQQNRHTKMKLLDLGIYSGKVAQLHSSGHRRLLANFCTLILKLNLKLLHVEPVLLGIMKVPRCQELAPRILSMIDFDITDPCYGNLFTIESMPELEGVTLCADFFSSNLEEDPVQVTVTRNLSFFSAEKMPKLQKLTLTSCACICKVNGARLLTAAWSHFPWTEEVHFQYSAFAQDVVFCGAGGELPFLQLTS